MHSESELNELRKVLSDIEIGSDYPAEKHDIPKDKSMPCGSLYVLCMIMATLPLLSSGPASIITFAFFAFLGAILFVSTHLCAISSFKNKLLLEPVASITLVWSLTITAYLILFVFNKH
jgi:hypothetical protein